MMRDNFIVFFVCIDVMFYMTGMVPHGSLSGKRFFCLWKYKFTLLFSYAGLGCMKLNAGQNYQFKKSMCQLFS